MQAITYGRSNGIVSPSSEIRSRNERIQSIAFKTFMELSLSLAIGFAVSFFITPASIGYLFSTLAIRCLFSFVTRIIQPQDQSSVFDYARATNFSWTTGNAAQILVHEGGHALSTFLVYENPSPAIQIHLGRGGATSFSVHQLSRFGKLLGARYSLALVTAAGASLTLFVSSILLWLGLKLRRTSPEISAYLLVYAATDFATHVYYAISALWAPTDHLSHDFVRLTALTGLHPVVAAVAMVAIPILLSSYVRRS